MEFYTIAGIGFAALVGVFWKMIGGFGPYNLRAIGIVIIATFATLLGMKCDASLTASIGILGAIAGYLFSINASDEKKDKKRQKEEDLQKQENNQ
jgi:hypothetical protein